MTTNTDSLSIEKSVVVYKDFIKLAGEFNAANLLSHLAYWCLLPSKKGGTKLRVEKNHKLWVANTRQQWCEKTGLSEWQFRKSVEKLVQKGYIEKTIGRFAGNVATFLRVLEDHVQVSIEDMVHAEEMIDALDHSGDNPQSTMEVSPILLDTESSAVSTTQASKLALLKSEQAEPNPNKEQTAMKLNSVLNQIQNKQKEVQTGPANVGKLALVWKKRMKDFTPDFVKDLTLKEKGQLKQFLSGVGPERATWCLEYAFANWSKFTWAVKTQKAAFSLPEQPTTGFLLQHYDVLLQLIAKTSSSDGAPQATIAPSKEPEVVAPPKPEEAMPTQEEMQAAMAELLKTKD